MLVNCKNNLPFTNLPTNCTNYHCKFYHGKTIKLSCLLGVCAPGFALLERSSANLLDIQQCSQRQTELVSNLLRPRSFVNIFQQFLQFYNLLRLRPILEKKDVYNIQVKIHNISIFSQLANGPNKLIVLHYTRL